MYFITNSTDLCVYDYTNTIDQYESKKTLLATVTVAIGIFCNFAYYYSYPGLYAYQLIPSTITALVLPNFALELCSPNQAKILLTITLLAVGCNVICVSTLIITKSLTSFFLCDALVALTAYLGYALPYGMQAIKKSIDILFNPNSTEAIASLQKGYKFFEIWKLPEDIELINLLMNPRSYLTSPNSSYSQYAVNFYSQNQLKKAFDDKLEALSAIYINETAASTPMNVENTLHESDELVSLPAKFVADFEILKKMMQGLLEIDCEDALTKLLIKMSLFVPKAISSDDYVGLFSEKFIKIISNRISNAEDKIDAIKKNQIAFEKDFSDLNFLLEKCQSKDQINQVIKKIKKINASKQSENLDDLKELEEKKSELKLLIRELTKITEPFLTLKCALINGHKEFCDISNEIKLLTQLNECKSFVEKIGKGNALNLLTDLVKNTDKPGLHQLNTRYHTSVYPKIEEASNLIYLIEEANTLINSTETVPESAYNCLLTLLRTGDNLSELAEYLSMTALDEDVFNHRLSEFGLITAKDLTDFIPKNCLSGESEIRLKQSLKAYFNEYFMTVGNFFETQCPLIWLDSDVHPILDFKSKIDRIKILEDLGLKTKKDLITHGLLPSDEEIISIYKFDQDDKLMKAAYLKVLKPKLKNFFEGNSSKNYVTEVTSLEKSPPFIQLLAKKVSALIYYLISAGITLMPLAFFPKAALLGFTSGFAYYGLRRFTSAPLIKFEAKLSQYFGLFYNSNLPLTHQLFQISSPRNIIYFTSKMRDGMKIFSESDIFSKARIINTELGLTLGFKCAFRFGGALQGFSFASCLNEMV